MEQKNRLIIAFLITVLMAVAIFTSFGRGIFAKKPPEIVLPDPGSSQSGSSSAPLPGDSSDYGQRVEVTPQTVQSVIASLSRSTSYFREVILENHWGPEDITYTNVQTWVDDDWTRTTQVTPSGLTRHDLVGDGTVYYWYDGDRTWCTAPADATSADLAQHIPTYETVLELDADSIISTGYELCGGQPCIFVHVQTPVAGYQERYWVSVDSGLLVSAESYEEDTLVYRMTAFSPIQSLSSDNADRFTLPDGAVLHTP